MSLQSLAVSFASHVCLDATPDESIAAFKSIDPTERIEIFESVAGELKPKSRSKLWKRLGPRGWKLWCLSQLLKDYRLHPENRRKYPNEPNATNATERKAEALRLMLFKQSFDIKILVDGLRYDMTNASGRVTDTPFRALATFAMNGTSILIDRRPDPKVLEVARASGVTVIVANAEDAFPLLAKSNKKVLVEIDFSGNDYDLRKYVEFTMILEQKFTNCTVIVGLSSPDQFKGKIASDADEEFSELIGRSVTPITKPTKGVGYHQVVFQL